MIYAVILASGQGKRIKDKINLPKQFREIEGKPIIIYTIKNILKVDKFDKLYLVVPKDYIDFTKSIIDKYILKDKDKIFIIAGGKERMDSIDNSIFAIKNDQSISDDDIIVIHDGVRPFVTEKILNDSIDMAKKMAQLLLLCLLVILF